MKAILLIISISLYLTSNADDLAQLKLTKDGISSIVVNTDSISAEILYKRALNWVQETYKNPSEVLKAKIENEKIRIEGYDNEAFYDIFASSGKVFYQMTYTLEIEFKNNKYKYTYTPNEIFVDETTKVFFSLQNLLDDKDINGNSYKLKLKSFESKINELHKSFYSYVTNTVKKSEW